MNGTLNRVLARSLSLAVLTLPACQSYQTFKPTIATSPLAGPAANNVKFSQDTVALPVVGSPSSGPVVMNSMSAPLGPTASPASMTLPTASGCGPSGCGDGCNGQCNAGCKSCGLKQCLKDFNWEQLRTDHCWPDQYNYESRRRVNQPLHDQIAAGHATVQTLHEFHFTAEPAERRGELNEAGKSRLRYLARRRPFVVPTVFVQTTLDRSVDQLRQDSVRQYASSVSGEPVAWQVTTVNTQPNGQIGVEGATSIAKMIGPTQGQVIAVPHYEQIVKNTFYQGSGGGQQSSGGSSGGS